MYSILEMKHQTLQKSIGALMRINFIARNGCRTIFILVLFLFISYSGSAASYYVSNAGNDSNNGLSEATAWRTLSKVNGFTFTSNDAILLKRGDEWREQLTIPRSYLIIDAYGSGAKPIINAADLYNTDNWGDITGSLWTMPMPNGADTSFVVVVDDILCTKKLSKAALTTDYEYFIDTDNSKIVLRMNYDPDNHKVEISKRHYGIYCLRKTYINISNLTVINTDKEPISGGGAGIFLLGNSSGVITDGYITIDNCTTYHNAHVGITVAQFYNHITIQNCETYKNGNGIYFWTGCDYALIKNNNVHNNDLTVVTTDWDGIGVYMGSFCTIENNHVYNNGLGNGIDVCGNFADGSLIIRNNIVHNNCGLLPQTASQSGIHISDMIGESNIASYNLVYDNLRSAYSGSSFWLEDTNVKLYNNTSYFAGMLGTAVVISGAANNVTLRNNIFCSYGIYGLSIYAALSTYTIDSDNNLFYIERVDNKPIYLGVTGYTLSGWQTYSSHDANTVQANPSFTTNGSNLTLQAGSPAINAGVDVGLTTDILGKPIVGLPDIGAYENGNAVVPSAPISVVAIAGNTSASVSFLAPTNNGGSAITGYTVKSIPAGGTDVNAGSTSLTHTITGLTNGTSYTFTVKATNSAGNSVASASSNLVIPSAPIDNIVPIISAFSIPATSNSLTVSISAFTATDNVGVTGYLLTESPSIPLATAVDWTTFAPSTYIFLSAGSNTIYAWAKDGVGNVSVSLKQVVTITLDVVPSSEFSQTLELKKGYNMISTYVSPSDSVVSDMTQPIVADGNLIKIQDESGNSYENWGSFGGWINNLGSIQKTEGYKIKVAENCMLQVTGRQITLPMNIPLNAGWNIISYPRTDALDGKMIIQSLIDQNKLIKVQDEAGNSIEDWGIYGGWKNGIGNFIPGKAYRVKMSAGTVLTIHENYPKSANLPVYAEKTSYFSSQTEGNGVDHMNINIVGLKEAGLSAGNELAAFDGDVCVGTLKITNSNLNIGSASLIASSLTNSQIKDGFKDGTSVQLYVWNQISGLESKVEAVPIKGSLNYQKNASILVKMKSLTTSVATQNTNMLQIEVYPNPSQGRFTVRFSELPEAGSRIEVLDLSGRKVASRIITGITEELNLYGQAAGLYLVKSILRSSEKVQKLVIQ